MVNQFFRLPDTNCVIGLQLCLSAILIHFHMFHRGSARTVDAAKSPLVATDDPAKPPLRPMVSCHKRQKRV